MILFFDLDGPILDVQERYYRIYTEILVTYGAKPVSGETYWAAKRNKVPEAEILAMSGMQSQEKLYHKTRRQLIESADYLEYDRLQDSAADVLGVLRGHARLVLVTLRNEPDTLAEQLKALGIDTLFDTVLVSGSRRAEQKWTIKRDLVLETFGDILEDSEARSPGYFIGDTETDILAGQALGLRTIGVLNGIRTKPLLEACQPDCLVPAIGDVLPLLTHVLPTTSGSPAHDIHSVC